MDGLWFPDYFRELNIVSVLLRVMCSILCGGVVGIEREWRHRTAGFKTHILVCMGAAICMVTGQYATQYFQLASIDPTRIGAQVVSGIGFLGVGTIIVTKDNKVKGLSTAAGLWVSACIGLAIGIGFFEIALVATVCVLGLFLGVKRFQLFSGETDSTMLLYLELQDVLFVKELLAMLREKQCTVFRMDMQGSRNGEVKNVGLILGVHSAKVSEKDILLCVSQQDYVVSFEELDN